MKREDKEEIKQEIYEEMNREAERWNRVMDELNKYSFKVFAWIFFSIIGLFFIFMIICGLSGWLK